jgi:hypothetical protein
MYHTLFYGIEGVAILISFAGLRKKSAHRYLVPEQKLKEEKKENKQCREHRGEGNKIAATSLKYNFFSVRSVVSF